MHPRNSSAACNTEGVLGINYSARRAYQIVRTLALLDRQDSRRTQGRDGFISQGVTMARRKKAQVDECAEALLNEVVPAITFYPCDGRRIARLRCFIFGDSGMVGISYARISGPTDERTASLESQEEAIVARLASHAVETTKDRRQRTDALARHSGCCCASASRVESETHA